MGWRVAGTAEGYPFNRAAFQQPASNMLADLFMRLPPHIPLPIAWLDADHNKAAETAKLLEKAGLPVRHLHGRQWVGADGVPMCRRLDMVGTAHGLGLSVHANLCARPGAAPCPWHSANTEHATCGFFAQAEKIPDRCILIATHNALATGFLPGMVPLPSVVIVDEGALRALRRDPVHCKLDALRELVGRLGPHWGDGIGPDVAAVLGMLSVPTCELGDWREYLSARGVSSLRLAEVADAVRRFARKWRVGTPGDEGSILLGLSFHQKNRALPALVALLEALELDWSMGRPVPQSVTTEEWQDGDGKIHLSVYITPALPLIEGRAILALDASADHFGARALYGPDVRFETIEVERVAKLVQITKSFSKQALGLGDRVDDEGRERARKLILDLERAVARLVDRHGADKVGVVIPLELRKQWTGETKPAGFTTWRGALLGHLGALRGLDGMKDRTAAVVVGSQQPPRVAVERMARGDYARDPEPLRDLAVWGPGEEAPDFPMIERGFRMRDGRHRGMAVRQHPDERVDAILRGIRDEEVIQAVDRIRPVRADADAPKTIFVLSLVVLPLLVDEVLGFDEWLRIVETECAAARDGYLSLNRTGLAKQAPAVLRGRGGEALAETEEKTRARKVRNQIVATSESFRKRGRGGRNLIQKYAPSLSTEWETAPHGNLCGIVTVASNRVVFVAVASHLESVRSHLLF